MKSIERKHVQQSNRDTDWAAHYDYYEVELRDMYKTVSRRQNESHFEMLKHRGASFMGKDKSFCEIGFSAGLTLRLAHKYFGKITGLDISPRNVDYTARELESEGYSGIELYVSNLMDYDERFENCFDVISFIHGLEHFSSDDYPLVFENIKRYLKPGGVFTGALPFRNTFKFRMCPKCNHVFEIDGHVSSHDIQSLTRLFRDHGFDIIYIGNYNIHYSAKQGSIIRRAFKLLYFFLFIYLLKKPIKNQIEYIVKSTSRNKAPSSE
ncbi:MAG: class I SAM-dependent methyltransferase [Bacteroidales bacterium]|nr:class I SAM-dependent methyltransferase [Bacteroidales bacterium]